MGHVRCGLLSTQNEVIIRSLHFHISCDVQQKKNLPSRLGRIRSGDILLTPDFILAVE
jgi:hypothetical protein